MRKSEGAKVSSSQSMLHSWVEEKRVSYNLQFFYFGAKFWIDMRSKFDDVGTNVQKADNDAVDRSQGAARAM